MLYLCVFNALMQNVVIQARTEAKSAWFYRRH